MPLLHGFYDAFPNGRKVRSWESSVDLHADIKVLEVRDASLGYAPFYVSWEAWNRRGYFIAVRFVNDDGVELWTNYSRDDFIWLLPSEDSD